MPFLYNLVIHLYSFGIYLASFFHVKANQWIGGRKGLLKKLETWKKQCESSDSVQNKPTIWIHAASLGEFEQGRPIIEKLKKRLPAARIVLSLFSPSAYEIRKDYADADLVTYLPADTSKNASRFIQLLSPDLVIFIKYEFWYNYLRQLQAKGIPTLLVSALFRPEQYFFQWYGSWFRKVLAGFEHIFAQNKASFQLLKAHHIEKVSIAGDTRIDRVMDIAKSKIHNKRMEQFVQNHPVLICGSTWPEDEILLAELIKNKKGWKFIIAPHEIEEHRLKKLENLLSGKSVRYSDTQATAFEEKTVMIIDNIGMLASLYQYGKVAYIGGGFGKGIHNILEPAAFHLPVIFGPNFRKFAEAVSLVEKGGAFTISDSPSLHSIFKKLENHVVYETTTAKVKLYLSENYGATDKVMDYISKLLKPPHD